MTRLTAHLFPLQVNETLREAGHATVIVEEQVAARMYTGPMYMKYNLVLRGMGAGQALTLSGSVGGGREVEGEGSQRVVGHTVEGGRTIQASHRGEARITRQREDGSSSGGGLPM